MQQTVISAKSGSVRGVLTDGLAVFKGIPYAAPPDGLRRFRHAEALDPHTGIRDATAPGPASPQAGRMEKDEAGCLTLNIWAPEHGNRLPVMFFIHGGSFIYGAGSHPLYDGSCLSREGDIVVVTFNYRLGVFGCLDFSAIDSRFQSNCAFSDMCTALRWVHANIDAFGGDPENITVVGQSAGAIAASAFPVSSDLQPLISKVIMMSGSPTYLRKKEEHQELGGKFFGYAGFSDAEELLAADAQSLAKLGKSFQKTCGYGEGTYTLDIDGELIRESPLVAASKGEGAGIPLLVGTTKEEMAFVCSPLFSEMLDIKEYLTSALSREDPQTMAGLRERYANFGKRAESLFIADRTFRLGSLWYAQMLSTHSNAWLYRFDFESRVMKMLGLRACHSCDLPLFFGNLHTGFFRFMYLFDQGNKDHIALMEEIHADIFRFMRTGELPWQRCTKTNVTAKIYDRQPRFASAVEEPIRRAHEHTIFYKETFEGIG